MNEQDPLKQEPQRVKEHLEGAALLGHAIQLRMDAKNYQQSLLGATAGRNHFMNAIEEKSNDLKTKYQGADNAQKWVAWHALIGSGPNEDDLKTMKQADFPGEDSVIDFLESLGPPKPVT